MTLSSQLRAEVKAQRPWALIVLTILLFVQVAGFVGVAFWCAGLELPLWPLPLPWFDLAWPEHHLWAGVAAILALLTLLSAVGLLLLRRAAWVLAALVQCLTLALGLGLRFSPVYDFSGRALHSYGLYLALGFAVIQVVYLNTRDVQQALTSAAACRARGGCE